MSPASAIFRLSDNLVLLSSDFVFTSRLLEGCLPAAPLDEAVSGLEALVEADLVPDGFELTLADTFLVEGVVAGFGLIPLELLVFSVPSDDLAFVSLAFDLAVDEEESPADFALALESLGDIAEDLVTSLGLAAVVVVVGSTVLLLFGMVLIRLLPEEMHHPSSLT